MNIYDLVKKNRSYRRFDRRVSVNRNILEELVDLARLSASAANLQPLKYYLSCDAETNDTIFTFLAWAGYLKDWPGPAEEQRPAAYIIILGDRTICKSFGCDHGIAAQSILLGATEKQLGGCMIASIRRKELAAVLNLSDRYEILLAIAIGKPAETVTIEPLPAGDSIRYWRDDADNHHVPKRSLSDLIIN